MSKLVEATRRIEEVYGGITTYATAGTTAGVGVWIGENWFLVLSAIAVVIRMCVDIQSFLKNRKKNNG